MESRVICWCGTDNNAEAWLPKKIRNQLIDDLTRVMSNNKAENYCNPECICRNTELQKPLLKRIYGNKGYPKRTFSCYQINNFRLQFVIAWGKLHPHETDGLVNEAGRYDV